MVQKSIATFSYFTYDEVFREGHQGLISYVNQGEVAGAKFIDDGDIVSGITHMVVR